MGRKMKTVHLSGKERRILYELEKEIDDQWEGERDEADMERAWALSGVSPYR